jgi:uncharacterized protein (DUF1778 family)
MPRAASQEAKEERIDLRANREVKEVIQRAADLLGTTTSAFVINHAYEAAQRVIAERETLLLSDHDRDLFFSMLDNPPKPNAALKRLLRQGKATSQNP